MTQARGPILNPGVYWIDAFHKAGQPDFNTWLARSKGLAVVLTTALHIDETPPRDWVLFEVKFPAPWTPQDAALFGFPTVAPKGRETTEEDSRSAPDPTPSFNPQAFFEGLSGGSGILLLIGLLYVLNQGGGRR